jgi:predicted Zn-dependent protease
MSPEARANPAVLALEGDEKLMQGDIGGASDLYTKMAAGDAAQLRLAGVAYLEGDRARMTAELKTLTGERTAHDWYTLGSDQQARGEFAAAIAPLAACIEADSAASPCYERLGRTLLQAGKNEMALAVLHEGLRRRPQDAELQDLLKQLESGTSRVALGPR